MPLWCMLRYLGQPTLCFYIPAIAHELGLRLTVTHLTVMHRELITKLISDLPENGRHSSSIMQAVFPL